MAKKKQKLLEVEAEKIEEKHEEVMEGDEHEISFVRSESVVHSHLGSDDMADLEDSKICFIFRICENSTCEKWI